MSGFLLCNYTRNSWSASWSSFAEMPACLPFSLPFRPQREATIARLGGFVPICHCLLPFCILRVTQCPQNHIPHLPLWHPEPRLCHSQTHDKPLRLLLMFLFLSRALLKQGFQVHTCANSFLTGPAPRWIDRLPKRHLLFGECKCCLYVMEPKMQLRLRWGITW